MTLGHKSKCFQNRFQEQLFPIIWLTCEYRLIDKIQKTTWCEHEMVEIELEVLFCTVGPGYPSLIHPEPARSAQTDQHHNDTVSCGRLWLIEAVVRSAECWHFFFSPPNVPSTWFDEFWSQQLLRYDCVSLSYLPQTGCGLATSRKTEINVGYSVCSVSEISPAGLKLIYKNNKDV